MILRPKFFHNLLNIAILLKGLNGLFELAGSLILFFFASKPVTAAMQFIFYNELAHDKDDLIANFVVNLLGEMSRSTRLFSATVLLILALINLCLVIAIWKEKYWIYPSVAIVIILLVIYQIFRFSHTGSIILFLWTILDIIIVYLLIREYIYHRNKS